MSIEARKLNLIEWLAKVEDVDLIQQLEVVRDSDGVQSWDDLGEERQRKIERSIQQMDEGKGIPHEEVMADSLVT